jgi:uncharacterized membrane protein (UPF0127 family)
VFSFLLQLMQRWSPPRRFEGLPWVTVGGVEVPVAIGFRARLLGLSHLDREEAGRGLLIPRCSSVHTFGMRFHLDLVFFDRRDRLLAIRSAIPTRRLVGHRGAAAVLELPATAASGNFATGGGDSELRPTG